MQNFKSYFDFLPSVYIVEVSPESGLVTVRESRHVKNNQKRKYIGAIIQI